MIECKQAILDKEISLVKEFLAKHDLSLEDDCDVTLFLTDSDKIIGTISKSKSVIKCVAIDPSYQGEDLMATLINKIIEKANEEKIYSYQVYTKLKYKRQFESLGFKELVESKDAIYLEKGNTSIYDTLKQMRQIIENNLGSIDESSDIGCITMNANPFTLGHQYLVETAAKNHDYLIIFVVSEDKSEFSYQERASMVYLGTSRFKNVVIVPSSIYMVSSFTFPTYFIHDNSLRNKNAATLDALMFKNYFMKELFIKKRYVGSETKDYMVEYNSTLKDILKDSLVEIERNQIDNTIVSASKVRELLKEHKIEEALNYIPMESKTILRLLANKIYGC